MKPLLLTAILLGHALANTATGSQTPKPKPKTATYLCQGSASYAYHSTTRCEGLA